MAQEHSYRCELVWSGSTAEGTTGYQRAHQVLRPRITVAPGTDEDAVRRAVSEAHAACFIANTLNTAMTIEATVTAG